MSEVAALPAVSSRSTKRRLNNAAAADEESKQVLGGAVYYNPTRLSIPRLANDYVAVRKSISYPNGINANVVGGIVRVPYGTDPNQLFSFEPYISPGAFAGGANTLINQLLELYDEFRVRGLKVELIPLYNETMGLSSASSGATTNHNVSPHFEAYIWYPSNHYELDLDTPAAEMPDYLTLRNAKGAGEKIVKVASERSKRITTSYAPQIVDQSDSTQGFTVYKDIQAPWMLNDATRRAVLLRAPRILFKKPYVLDPTRDAATFYYADYQVIVHCIFEFRNIDCNKV